MQEATKGVWAMVLACTFWGLSPLYYKLLEHVPPIEILAHRTLWSVGFFTAILLFQRRISTLYQVVANGRSFLILSFGALMISFNWFIFITSIQVGKAVEASMGYYTFPLVVVLFGAIFFGERLGRAQLLAVALAVVAVVTLTAGLGVAPWIALLIATSFGLYGVVKKRLSIGPVVSVTAEVMLLSPIAIVILWSTHKTGAGAFGATISDSLLLVLSGPITAIPLITFSYATKRVSLATIGLVQYLNPTLQFLVATLIFREAFSFWHAVAFAMIWTVLAIYTAAIWGQDRAARRATPSP